MFPFLGSLDTRSLQDNDDSNEDDSLQLTICPAVPLDENIESDVSVRGSSGVFWLDGNVIYENALRFSNSVGEVPKKRGKQMNTSAWFRDKRLRRTVMEETRLVHWTNAFPSHDRMGKIETLRMHKEGILFAMRRDEFEKSKRSRTGIRKNSKAQMEEHFEKQFSTLERLTNENTAPFAQVGNMLSTFDVVWTSTFPFWEYGKGAKRLTIIVPAGTEGTTRTDQFLESFLDKLCAKLDHSCFTNATKDTQVTHVHPKRKADWDTRIRELVNTVRNVLDPTFPLPPKQPDRPLLICELFYDDVMATPEDKRVAKALAASKTIKKRKRGL